MTTKKKIIIGGIVVLTILLLILLWWLLFFKTSVSVKTVVVDQNNTNFVVAENRIAKTTPPAFVPPKTTIKVSGIESLATVFAERYGSFSSESDMENLKDVLDFMSSGLRAKTENYLVTAKPITEYYGVTTKALAVVVDSLDETGGVAKVEVSTQREESKGSPQKSEIKYQILVLQYVKEAGVWKVDSADWQ